MIKRMILWAVIGLLVGCSWVAYAFETVPDYEQRSEADRVISVLAYATCPIIAAAPRFYWIPLANATTYALLCFGLELTRKKWSGSRTREPISSETKER